VSCVSRNWSAESFVPGFPGYVIRRLSACTHTPPPIEEVAVSVDLLYLTLGSETDEGVALMNRTNLEDSNSSATSITKMA